MSAWPCVRLGDVADIERNIVAPEAIQSGAIYVGLENIASGGDFIKVGSVESGELKSAKFAFTPSHILYGKLRPYLAKIALPSFAGVCSTDILPVRPGKQLNRQFAAHFLRQPEMVDLATSRSSGANLPRLSPNDLAAFEVPLPPLEEQRRIVAILDQADALRATRRVVLAQLDEMAQAIFLEMFGDPAPNEREWPTKTVDEVCTRLTVGFVSSMVNEYRDTGIPLLRSLNVRRNVLDLTDLKYIGPDFHGALKKSTLRPGDVVTVRTGRPGATAVVPSTLPYSNCADLIVMSCGATVHPDYLSECLNQLLGDADHIQGVVGAIQSHFNIGAMRRQRIPCPPMALQRKFAERLLELKRLISKQETAGRQAEALFVTLQHRAFRGEL